jgi:hypothetical protein
MPQLIAVKPPRPVVLRGRGTQQAPLALQLFWADCGQ